MRIGLDIDGVMYMWSKTARYMLREVLPNSPYTKDGPLGRESESWDYIQQNIAPEHWKWMWTEGVRLGLFRYGHLYPGTIEAVRTLATLGEVVLITHRPKAAVTDTLAWITYQGLPLSGIHILTSQEPKSTVHPQCDVYLDDKPENCIDLVQNTNAKCVALMTREWNKKPQPWQPRLVRVFDWREFIAEVRNVA